MKRELEHYLRLRYPIELVEAEEGGYFARIPDLPGCMAQGETIDETLKSLEGAKSAWIEVRLEDGLDIPPPREMVDEYSGKFLLRVPKSFHRELATRAREEGTSLNQYVLHLLSLGLGLQRTLAQPFAIETIRPRRGFLQQIFKRPRDLDWFQMSGTIQEARPWFHLAPQYPSISIEEAEQNTPGCELLDLIHLHSGSQEEEDVKRKAAEALSRIGWSLEGHPAPKA